jgi:hypothetical protein
MVEAVELISMQDLGERFSLFAPRAHTIWIGHNVASPVDLLNQAAHDPPPHFRRTAWYETNKISHWSATANDATDRLDGVNAANPSHAFQA